MCVGDSTLTNGVCCKTRPAALNMPSSFRAAMLASDTKSRRMTWKSATWKRTQTMSHESHWLNHFISQLKLLLSEMLLKMPFFLLSSLFSLTLFSLCHPSLQFSPPSVLYQPFFGLTLSMRQLLFFLMIEIHDTYHCSHAWISGWKVHLNQFYLNAKEM